MIYVLAYPSFDPATAARVARFRRANEPLRANLVAPHVTLVFGVADRHAPGMITRCRDLAANTRAFTVTFASAQRVYDPFEKTHKLFLICGTGADTLTKLHNGLYTGPLQEEMDPDHPFRPHMTVATQSTGEEIDRLDPRVLGTLPIAAQIGTLALVEVTRGTLRPVATVSLLP